jgi:hypothetical protein
MSIVPDLLQPQIGEQQIEQRVVQTQCVCHGVELHEQGPRARRIGVVPESSSAIPAARTGDWTIALSDGRGVVAISALSRWCGDDRVTIMSRS